MDSNQNRQVNAYYELASPASSQVPVFDEKAWREQIAAEALKPRMRCASHLDPLLKIEQREMTIERMRDLMIPHEDKFDAIAVTGVSGALVGMPIAMALGKRLVVVRKKRGEEARHSYHDVEGLFARDSSEEDFTMVYDQWRIAIVDDLIDAGDTIDRMWTQLTNCNQKVVSVFLYNDQINRHGKWSSCLGFELPVFQLTS